MKEENSDLEEGLVGLTLEPGTTTSTVKCVFDIDGSRVTKHVNVTEEVDISDPVEIVGPNNEASTIREKDVEDTLLDETKQIIETILDVNITGQDGTLDASISGDEPLDVTDSDVPTLPQDTNGDHYNILDEDVKESVSNDEVRSALYAYDPGANLVNLGTGAMSDTPPSPAQGLLTHISSALFGVDESEVRMRYFNTGGAETDLATESTLSTLSNNQYSGDNLKAKGENIPQDGEATFEMEGRGVSEVSGKVKADTQHDVKVRFFDNNLNQLFEVTVASGVSANTVTDINETTAGNVVQVALVDSNSTSGSATAGLNLV